MEQKEKSKKKESGIVTSVVIIAIIVLIILGFSLFFNKNAEQKGNKTSEESESSLQDETPQSPEIEIIETPEPTEHIVNITLGGFVPKTLKIKKGEKVTWINQIATNAWVAGDVHPTHTSYPGSSIIKCGTAEEKNIFDSCKSFQRGESYSFVFNKVGNWGYHNHLNPSKDAKIIVEE